MSSNMPDPGTHHDYGRVTDQMYAREDDAPAQSREGSRSGKSSRSLKQKSALRQILELLFGLAVLIVLYGMFF